jgi:hypothetical protein
VKPSDPPVLHCLLPGYAIDYEAILSSAATDGLAHIAALLQKSLPSLWRDAYVQNVSHLPNLVSVRVGSYEYICDVYSDWEAKGEIAYDQSVQDRVVAAFGISGNSELQDARTTSRWIDHAENYAATERDHGHLIAHCIGGSRLGLNVFSQDRRLNRGRSTQGKIYRQMERYCQKQAGTFCFSRPIYTDASNIPRWLEFGLLKDDQRLWIEIFEN